MISGWIPGMIESECGITPSPSQVVLHVPSPPKIYVLPPSIGMKDSVRLICRPLPLRLWHPESIFPVGVRVVPTLLYPCDILPCMPDVKRDEVGRRVFQLKQKRSVEEAIAIIRSAQGKRWNDLAEDDVEIFRVVLEEFWLQTDREDWKSFSFSRLSPDDILSIIRMGYSVKNKTLPKKEADSRLREIFGRTVKGA